MNAYSIVFVHVGYTLPKHLSTSVAQARLFNKECPIYLIAHQSAIDKDAALFEGSQVTFIPCESLQLSEPHQLLKQNYPNHDWGFGGIWVYSSERFFYLQEFVSQNSLTDVFHFENDIMLYVNLKNLLPTFHKHYEGMIAATFENDNRCVPGFMYISNPLPLTKLIESYPVHSFNMRTTDMEVLAQFKYQFQGIYIDYLPIVHPEYVKDYFTEPLSNAHRPQLPSAHPELFSKNFDEFHSLFDGAAWGIFLGGSDSLCHANSAPGQCDPYCIFKPTDFTFEWKKDNEGRRIPSVTYKDRQVFINNLHITNKPIIHLFNSLTE